MKFSRWLFRIAGMLWADRPCAQYFLESRIGEQNPPAITHPEFFLRIFRRSDGLANYVFDHCAKIRCNFGR